MPPDMYKSPKIYEIAFSYRDIEREINFLESALQHFSPRTVNSILDIACGTCLHMAGLMKDGYDVEGLDISPEMLQYGEERLEQMGLKAKVSKKDMRKFSMNKKFDAAFCIGNSLSYLVEDEDHLSHLQSIEQALEEEGLYIVNLENRDYWLRNDVPAHFRNSWEREEDGVEVRADLQRYPMDEAGKIHQVELTLTAESGERTSRTKTTSNIRAFAPGEFSQIAEKGGFRVLEYFDNFDMESRLEGNERWEIIGILKKADGNGS